MKKHLFLLYYIFFSFSVLLAQNPVFHQINDENGLPANTIYSVVQDHEGFVWIGCEAGIYKYNGSRFIRYRNENQKSFSMTGLCLAGDGRIYCYNFSNQIFYIHNDSLHEIKSWEGKRSRGFPNIAVGKNNKLYACSETALLCYEVDSDQWQAVNQHAGIAGSLAADTRGEIWYGAGLGEVATSTGKRYNVPIEAGNPTNMGEYFICGTRSSVWLFSMSGGHTYKIPAENGKQFEPQQSPVLKECLKNRKITSTQFINNKIYICTYTGVIIYDEKADNIEVWYENKSFSRVLLDHEQNIWLSGLGNGIYLIPEKDFRVWNEQDKQLPENRVADITTTKDSIFFSMYNGFVGMLNQQQTTPAILSHPLKADIRSIFYESGKLYFNANGKLFYCEKKEIKQVLDESGPVKKIIKADGYYILCTSLGTFCYKKLHNSTQGQPIAKQWARDAVYLAATNRLYIATNDGLLMGDFKEGIFGSDSLLLATKQIISLAENEKQNGVYLLTFKGEIYAHEVNSLEKIAQLPQETQVYDLVYHQQKFYVASNAGLWIYEQTKKRWQQIERVAGLVSNSISAMAIQEEQLWLATAKGLQRLPLAYQQNKPLPKVFLRAIKVNGTNAEKNANTLEIPYQSVLSLNVEALAYASLQQFKFAYRLLGEDSTAWTYTNANATEIPIVGINSGFFSIALKAIDHRGRESDNQLIIKGYMVPPFWQRWWFYVSVALAGMSAAYLLFHFRIKSLQKRQQEKIAKIELENTLKLSQQAALKAQMNPHFIFNVLNSIKSYIYENDKKQAVQYLSKFADLIRCILNMSSQKSVKLSEEIRALELYIQLEAMQLEPPFEYNIVVDENIDADGISIPSLIIQPFVENTFKHAFPLKTGLKKLDISFRFDSLKQLLTICIDDNGIGRTAAAVAATQKNTNHRSFATEANTKRLDLLNQSADEERVSLRFEDKTNAEGGALGTRVVLYLAVGG